MTTTERNTLLLLFGVGVVGHGARIIALAPENAPGAVSILSQLPAGDLGAQRARVVRAERPLAMGELVDVNTASAQELARLPRVGLSLAREIVRARQDSGGFASLADLDRIPGVGPGLLRTIQGHITLGDTLKARRAREQRGAGQAPAVFTSPEPQPQVPTVVLRERGSKGRPKEPKGPLAPSAPIHLNQATEAELVTLPGIGPTRARKIIAYRESHGPFRSPADLERVPGLPRRLAKELATRVVVP
jgi:competence ComEA-like helix-hairpin-helix protein